MHSVQHAGQRTERCKKSYRVEEGARLDDVERRRDAGRNAAGDHATGSNVGPGQGGHIHVQVLGRHLFEVFIHGKLQQGEGHLEEWGGEARASQDGDVLHRAGAARSGCGDAALERLTSRETKET